MRSSQFMFRRTVSSGIKWCLAATFLFAGCEKKPPIPISPEKHDTVQTPIQDTVNTPNQDTIGPAEPNSNYSIGGYNVYFGHLHNHSDFSDGTGSPSAAYTYARDNAKLDFFGLADHGESINDLDWSTGKNEADKFNQDSVFVTFWGFEWSSGNYGHVAVIGTDDYCTALQSGTNTFEGLCNWLSSREAIAFFNHPGRQSVMNLEFDHFNGMVCDKFVGMELWNKSDGFSVYYYNDGFYSDDNNKGCFDEALSRGWKIGAGGSDDNHYSTWGTANQHRLAILANNLTRRDLLAAINNRRFYSTLDKNLSLSFKLNGQEMGSTINGAKLLLEISAKDGDGENFEKVQLIDQNHSTVKSWSPNSSSIKINDSIEAAENGYFYITVKQSDGSEAISSPIWVNSNSSRKTVQKRIVTGMDDVEEDKDGKVYSNSTDIELVEDSLSGGSQIIGLRFTGLNIPNNAIISKAWLQFTCDEKTSSPATITIKGEASDNSVAFSESSFDVSSRQTTKASVTWLIPAWNTTGEATENEKTPELKSVIQEIVSINGFTPSSPITFIIKGEGTRTAEAYEGSSSKAAQLHLEYEIP